MLLRELLATSGTLSIMSYKHTGVLSLLRFVNTRGKLAIAMPRNRNFGAANRRTVTANSSGKKATFRSDNA